MGVVVGIAALVLVGGAAATLGRTTGVRVSRGTARRRLPHATRIWLRRCTGREPSSCGASRRSGPRRCATLEPRGAAAARCPGSASSAAPVARGAAAEPALAVTPSSPAGLEWEYHGTHEDGVPDSVLRSAASVRIAVIDTGADLTAPDLAAKSPTTYNTRTGTHGRPRRQRPRHVRRLARGRLGDERRRDRRLRRRRAAARGQGGPGRRHVHGRRRGGRDRRTRSTTARGSSTSASAAPGRRRIERNADPATRSTTARSSSRPPGTSSAAGIPSSTPPRCSSRSARTASAAPGCRSARRRRPALRARFSNTGSWISLARARARTSSATLSSLSPASMYPRSPLPGSQSGVYGYSQRHVVRGAAGRGRGRARLGARTRS